MGRVGYRFTGRVGWRVEFKLSAIERVGWRKSPYPTHPTRCAALIESISMDDEGIQKVDGVEDQQKMMADSDNSLLSIIQRKRSRVVEADTSKSKLSEVKKKRSKSKVSKRKVENAEPPELVEEQKDSQGEIEKLQARVRALEKLVGNKAELEVEVEILKDKVDELTGTIESLEDLNQVLIVKERRCNDELQEARAALIQEIGESSNSGSFIGTKGMKELGSKNPAYNDLEEIGESSNSQSAIGIKRMGDLALKPFRDALKDICSSSSTDQVSDQAVLLCSFWEQMLKDPLWHPFKITPADGIHQEVIDEEDRLLEGLKNSWGEEAYSAVVDALVELNEYAPSSRYPVQELWNFEENRRATAKEGVVTLAHLLREYHPADTPLRKEGM